MALYLVELTPANPSKEEATALIETVNSSLTHGAELIETQVSADHKIVFVIIEAENTAFGPDLAAAIGERASEVPEVSYLRTYVREDTAKCLCFYDAPDEEAVVRARKAVSTPIDRLFKLHA